MAWCRTRLGCNVALALLAPAGCETGAVDDEPDPQGAVEPMERPDHPGFEFVSASYSFDSSCGGEDTFLCVRLTAIDQPIQIDDIAVSSYEVVGYMSGDDARLWWADVERFPIPVGESLQVSLYDARDGSAGACESFDPESWEVDLHAEFVLHGESIVVDGTSSIGCGWSECGG